MSSKATAIFEADDKQLSNALLNINRKLLAFQQSDASEREYHLPPQVAR